MASTRKKIIVFLISILAFLVVLGLGYSLFVTIRSNPSQGLVTCTADGSCFWTAHIHAYVPVYICGSFYKFPHEVGPLDHPHTHEEQNIIHWHDKLPYDQSSSMIIDTDPMTLRAFFDSISVPFSQDAISTFSNGNLCPNGNPGKVSVFVNGDLYEGEYGSYIWKDHDVISIYFTDQPITEIEAELKADPPTFPKLGRG